MLRLRNEVHAQMVGHCLDGLPLEACGLLGGDAASGLASVCYPTDNEAASAKVFTIPGLAYMRAERDAESQGLELIGVFHSHTHTDAYPSPTDVVQAEATGPEWHYVLVSLRDIAPVVRSYRIVDGKITEEPVVLEGR